MSMGKNQKLLRKWFQRHKWHTADTPTGIGVYMESPVLNNAGFMEFDNVQKKYFCKESFLSVELDRLGCNTVTIGIHTRKHWWKRDTSVPDVPENDGKWFSWIPSDEFEQWKRNPDASITLPARDFIKFAELIQEAQKDYCRIMKKKYNPASFTGCKDTGYDWIGVNSSYDQIKERFKNSR